jgi:predicted MFS family arabinose efflux permease
LYFCQGLPGGFLAVALPVILLDQGVSLTGVGFVSVLSLPWMLKILWAPIVDRHGSRRFGRRKSWMLPAMAGMLLCTLAIGAQDPVDDLAIVLGLFFALNLAAATQDIAVDGFAVSTLRGRELGLANSAQVGGFKLGNLCGGGVLLALSSTLGWAGVFACMAGVIALAMVAVYFASEPDDDGPVPRSTMAVVREVLAALVAAPMYAAFLFAAKFGETVGGALLKPSMYRHGFGKELIGTIDGIFGSIATALGALVGGLVARRWGWARALVVMSIVQGAALIVIAVYQTGQVDAVGYGVRLVFENFAGGGVGVAVFMLAMSRSRPEIGAAQFTAAQVVYMLGAAVAGPMSLAIADATSIAPVMATGGVLALGVAAFAWRYAARIER